MDDFGVNKSMECDAKKLKEDLRDFPGRINDFALSQVFSDMWDLFKGELPVYYGFCIRKEHKELFHQIIDTEKNIDLQKQMRHALGKKVMRFGQLSTT